MVNHQIAAAILNLGKKLAPDRFPKPDPETAQAWARALDRVYPPALWEDAVYLWATQMVEDRMCTPKDMLAAARATVSRWESDPDKSRELEAFRHQRMDAKYQVMLGDRYTPDAVPGAPAELPTADEAAHFLTEVGARIAQNRAETALSRPNTRK